MNLFRVSLKKIAFHQKFIMDLFGRCLAMLEHVTITRGWVSYYSFLLVLSVDVRLFLAISKVKMEGGITHVYVFCKVNMCFKDR